MCLTYTVLKMNYEITHFVVRSYQASMSYLYTPVACLKPCSSRTRHNKSLYCEKRLSILFVKEIFKRMEKSSSGPSLICLSMGLECTSTVMRGAYEWKLAFFFFFGYLWPDLGNEWASLFSYSRCLFINCLYCVMDISWDSKWWILALLYSLRSYLYIMYGDCFVQSLMTDEW